MTKKVVSYPPHEFAQLPIFILRYIRSEGEQQYLHPIFEARGRCLPWVRFKVVRNSSIAVVMELAQISELAGRWLRLRRLAAGVATDGIVENLASTRLILNFPGF